MLSEPFVALALEAIRACAARVPQDDRDYESIALASQIYATCVYLLDAYKHAEMELPSTEMIGGGFRNAIAVASRIEPDGRGVPALYAELRKLLFALAHAYRQSAPDIRTTLHGTTELVRVEDPARGAIAIHGRVAHWLRPPSEWRALRARRLEVFGLGLNEYYSTLEQDLFPLAMHWNRALPDVGPIHHDDPALEDLRRFSAARAKALKVALCPLVPDATPRFCVVAPGYNLFTIDRARPISDPERLCAHLHNLVEEAARERVDILVLPELCVDPSARTALIESMQRVSHRFLAVIAGSFHIWPSDQSTRPINEAVVAGARRMSRWRHLKHGSFKLLRKDVEKGRGTFFPHDLDMQTLADEVSEHLENGSEILVCDAAIGRLAMVVCADILQPGSYAEVVKTTIRPDFLFIVSMSSDTRGFVAEAEAMLRCQVSTFYVNARCVCPRTEPRAEEVTDPPDLAFALLALREDVLPTRIGLYAGESVPRVYDLKQKVWKPMRGEGAAVLANGGLVVDIGAHFARS